MRIVAPSDIVLTRDKLSSEQIPARSRIVAGGRDTGQMVDGGILEAAVRWKNRALLFVTDDTPFEEFLRIYLFDARWKLLDRAALGAMYSTGIFANLEMVPPNTLQFKFFSGTTWELELLDNAVFSLPFSSPRNVSRPFSLRKHFDLIEFPSPEIDPSGACRK